MNDTNPSVAIIIPCFNRWPFVCEAVDSVLKQTWSNTHCIIVDDASTDGSYTRLKNHYRAIPRVSVHQLQSNQGQSAARNYGVDVSTADYIGFLDSDDILVENSVANRIKYAQTHINFDGLIFGKKIDEISRKPLMPGEKNYSDTLSLSEYVDNMSWLCTNSFIMKRTAFQELQGFNTGLRKKEDIEFFLRALASREVVYANTPCCIVRDVDKKRARHDHKRIIQQGERFMELIRNNPNLTSALTSEQIKKLFEADIRSVLQSLYRTKQGQKFRSTMRDAIDSGKLRPDFRLIKRYALSFLRY